MGSNQISKLLAVLAALIGVAYFSGAFEQAPSTIDVPALNIETSSINKIEVITPRHTVIVDKASGTWQMTQPIEWPADTVAIRSFLNQLSRLQLETVVSVSAARHERYEVDSTAYTVKVNDGQDDYELILSPRGPSQTVGYMRLAGDDRVFAASPRLPLPLALHIWRDKTIAIIPSQQVTHATIERPEESYSLDRSQDGAEWTLNMNGESAQATTTAVMSWLSRFNNLKADGFVTELPVDAVQTHAVSFTLNDNTSIKLNIFHEESRFLVTLEPENGRVYYLRESSDPQVFPESATFLVTE